MSDSELLLAIYNNSVEISFFLRFFIGCFLAWVAFGVVFRWLR